MKYKVFGLLINCVSINKINKSVGISMNSIHHFT